MQEAIRTYYLEAAPYEVNSPVLTQALQKQMATLIGIKIILTYQAPISKLNSILLFLYYFCERDGEQDVTLYGALSREV